MLLRSVGRLDQTARQHLEQFRVHCSGFDYRVDGDERRISSKQQRFHTRRFHASIFSALVVLLGPGSMAMHATLTPIGGKLDMLSMYLVCAFMTAYAMQRFWGWKPLHFTIVFVSVIAVCEWAGAYHGHLPLPLLDYAGDAVFAFFIILASVFEILNSYVRKFQHQRKWAYYGLASLITAFIIWNLSQTGSPFCDPHSLIQGHAIWHLLDALAVYFLFRFYVSENA